MLRNRSGSVALWQNPYAKMKSDLFGKSGECAPAKKC